MLERVVRDLFDKTDTDGSGRLDRSEVRHLAEQLGQQLTDGELDEAMHQMDTGDNNVSKNEKFCMKNEEFCIKNEEICIENDDFCRTRYRARWVLMSLIAGGWVRAVASRRSGRRRRSWRTCSRRWTRTTRGRSTWTSLSMRVHFGNPHRQLDFRGGGGERYL